MNYYCSIEFYVTQSPRPRASNRILECTNLTNLSDVSEFDNFYHFKKFYLQIFLRSCQSRNTVRTYRTPLPLTINRTVESTIVATRSKK